MDNHLVLPSTGRKKPRFFYGYLIVLVAFLINLVIWGTLYSFGVFFKPLIAEFGWTRAETSGAFSLFMVVSGLSAIVAGRLNDMFGPRIVVIACGFFLGLGYLLMSQTSAIWQLYLFYGLILGIGTAGTVALTSTVARWFVKMRGLMTGIVLSGVGLGTMIMPPVANWIITSSNWHTAYIVLGIISLVLITSATQFLKRDPSQVSQSPYGAGKVKEESLNAKVGGFSLRKASRTKQLWMLCIIYLCCGFYVEVIMVHIVPHAIDIGISAASAAGIISIIGGLSICGRVISCGSGDRIGNKLALITSVLLLTIAFSFLLAAKELRMLYLFAIIFGFGYGGQGALMSTLIADLFGLRAHGVILGIFNFMFTIGGAIGPLLSGHIFDTSGDYHLAFLICLALTIVGLILSLLLRPTGSTVSKRIH